MLVRKSLSSFSMPVLALAMAEAIAESSLTGKWGGTFPAGKNCG